MSVSANDTGLVLSMSSFLIVIFSYSRTGWLVLHHPSFLLLLQHRWCLHAKEREASYLLAAIHIEMCVYHKITFVARGWRHRAIWRAWSCKSIVPNVYMTCRRKTKRLHTSIQYHKEMPRRNCTRSFIYYRQSRHDEKPLEVAWT
jgi:hypothetical protein